MRKLLTLTLLSSLAAATAQADQLLGQGRIDNSNRVILPGGPTLGRFENGKFTATPDAITGDGSDLVAKALRGAYGRSARDRANDAPTVLDFAPIADQPGLANGAKDARAALLAADAVGAFVIPPGAYKVSSNLTLASDVTFLAGGRLVPDSGVTITLNGQITAPRSAQIFQGAGNVVAAKASEVWTSWWGALANAATDAGPAFRAAQGSFRTVRSVPATYLFCTTVPAGPYGQDAAHTTGQYFPAAVWPMGFTDFTVDNTGSVFNTCDKPVPQAQFFFDRNYRARLTGGTYNGNHNLISDTASSVAVVTHNQVGSTFENFFVAGNYGGGGAGLAGNWIYNSTYRNIKMTGVGQIFDIAQGKNILIDGLIAIGADATQSGGPGSKGLSIIYDVVGKYDSRLPANLGVVDNDSITVTNSDFSNFNSCVFITSGKNYRFSGNHVHDCPGSSAGAQGIGYDLAYQVGFSDGFPITNLTIDGDIIENNGSAGAGAGVSIGNGAITNSDVMSGIRVTNTLLRNNRDVAIRATGTTNLRDIDVKSGNVFIAGANQPYAIGGNLVAIQDPPPAINCGTGASVQAGSGNNAGVVTEGNGSGGCTIGFVRRNAIYPTPPVCNVWPLGGAPAPQNVTVGVNGTAAFIQFTNPSGGTPAYGYSCTNN